MKTGLVEDCDVQTELFSMEIQTCAITAEGISIKLLDVVNVISFSCICTRCGERFVAKSSLETHMKIHLLDDDISASSASESVMTTDNRGSVRVVYDAHPAVDDANMPDISDVQADISDAQADISDVQADIDDVEADISDVQADIRDVQADISDVQADISDVQADSNDVGSDNSDATDNGRLYGDVGVTEPGISNVEIINSSNGADGRVEIESVNMAFCGDKKRLDGIDDITHFDVETVEFSRPRIQGSSDVQQLDKNFKQRQTEMVETSAPSISDSNCGNDLEQKQKPRQRELHTGPANEDTVSYSNELTIPSQSCDLAEERKQPYRKTKSKECNICGKEICGRNNFIDHMSMHAIEKPYLCSVCGDGYNTKSQLKLHLRTHTGDKLKHPCQQCGKEFKTASQLTRHISVHTGKKRYSCTVCDKGFDSKIHVSEHMWVHTGLKCHLCTVCGKTFAKFHHLRDHTLLHTGEKPHLCSICGKTFALPSSLKSHFKIHTGEKPFVCDICGKAFSQLGHLKCHAEKHTDVYVSCSLCGKSFKHKSSLVNHVKIQHEKKYITCKICGETFKKYDTLKTHSLRHAGEKPYSCSVCGNKFIRKAQLQDHARTHTEEKPFVCEQCGRAFRMRKNLMRHVKTMHKEQKSYETAPSRVQSIVDPFISDMDVKNVACYAEQHDAM